MPCRNAFRQAVPAKGGEALAKKKATKKKKK
jgi:hypothetical protein